MSAQMEVASSGSIVKSGSFTDLEKILASEAVCSPCREDITSPRSMKKRHEMGPIADVFENNRRWAESVTAKDPDFFTRIAEGQKPRYLYFGCSDSRVTAEDILGLGPGEVFVHRNVGALVPGNDLSSLSVLEYAVAHLGVTDIIVCGHYGCGAVKAACCNQDLGILETWLRGIRDVYRLHKDYIDKISDPHERHQRLVDLNVIEQCANLYKTAVIQNHWAKSIESDGTSGLPRIHACVFDLSTGLLKKLQFDPVQDLKDLSGIYSLIPPDAV